MIKVGVTGGIGSGKSTLCRFMADLGAKVVYADKLAREIMNHDLNVRKSIISTFGSESYNNDEINREFLTNEAFNNGRIEELNAIVHPVVQSTLLKLIDDEKQSGTKIFIYEAAILLKNGRPDFLDKIIWIETSPEARVQRVSTRDEVSVESVYQRISTQQSFESVRKYVDIVVNNSGDLQNLKGETERIFKELLS
ncbi:MAG TPA: dephospho-CoA kinase [Bacteroidetes bacterium]|nr:dephospho-CoA kinase [Bacteroidota bacterium]